MVKKAIKRRDATGHLDADYERKLTRTIPVIRLDRRQVRDDEAAGKEAE